MITGAGVTIILSYGKYWTGWICQCLPQTDDIYIKGIFINEFFALPQVINNGIPWNDIPFVYHQQTLAQA